MMAPLKIQIAVIPAPDYSTRGQAAAGIHKLLIDRLFRNSGFPPSGMTNY